MNYRKTLFEIQKGRRMHASGTWKATKKEDLLIKSVGPLFKLMYNINNLERISLGQAVDNFVNGAGQYYDFAMLCISYKGD